MGFNHDGKLGGTRLKDIADLGMRGGPTGETEKTHITSSHKMANRENTNYLLFMDSLSSSEVLGNDCCESRALYSFQRTPSCCCQATSRSVSALNWVLESRCENWRPLSSSACPPSPLPSQHRHAKLFIKNM